MAGAPYPTIVLRSVLASMKNLYSPLVKKGSYVVVYDALESKRLVYDIKMITLKWYKHILDDPQLAKELSISGKLL